MEIAELWGKGWSLHPEQDPRTMTYIGTITRGDGVKVSTMKGSENNDGFHMENGKIAKNSNHSGGILGGISDGGEIFLRAHIKPTPSIAQPQQTVTATGENISIEIKGRHDPVIVPRAVVVVESMAAITLVDAMFSNMSARMDYVKDFYL